MPLITICDGCGEEIEGVTQGRYELEIPTGNEWWASERLTFHGRGCLALWVDRTDPDGTFCPQCAPDALPPGADSPTPVSDAHRGVRFFAAESATIRPVVDGHDATEQGVMELMCGADGWALVIGQDWSICPIHHDVLVRVIYGNVSVEPIEPS